MTKFGKIIISGIVAIVLITVGFFMFGNEQKQDQESDEVTSEQKAIISEEYGNQTDGLVSEIDYSTLEKDSLYTKEEGKYENLSEVGKKLLMAVLALPDCINKPTLSYCYDYKQQIKRSSIIALKDDVVLVDIPSQKIGAFYKIYDLDQNKNIGKQMWHYDTNAKNKNLIIYVYDNDTSGQNLFYYRPGMRSFVLVLNSKILPTESYWYNVGMGVGLPDIYFKNNIFTISIFNKNKPWEAGSKSKKLREVTFDLNNL